MNESKHVSKKVSISQKIKIITEGESDEKIGQVNLNENVPLSYTIQLNENTRVERKYSKEISENLMKPRAKKEVRISISECDESSSEMNDDSRDESKLEIPKANVLLRRGSVEDLIKRKYEQDYKISERQFHLIKDYFENFQQDDLLEKKEFKKHLLKSIETKKAHIRASELDVDRTLDVIDSDSNEQLDFNEFIDYLTLFLANEHSLKKTIIATLDGHQFTNLKIGYLSPQEAFDKAEYLFQFYGKNVGKQEDLNDFLKFDENVSYEQFAEIIYPFLKDFVFVKF